MRPILWQVSWSGIGKVGVLMRGYRLSHRELKTFIRNNPRRRIQSDIEFFSFFKACLAKIMRNLFLLLVSGLRLVDNQLVLKQVLLRVL